MKPEHDVLVFHFEQFLPASKTIAVISFYKAQNRSPLRFERWLKKLSLTFWCAMPGADCAHAATRWLTSHHSKVVLT
eukprot:1983053-Rhodomonas_salina.1